MQDFKLFKGTWRVYEDGYTIKQHRSGQKEIVPLGNSTVNYNLFDQAGLFLDFINTDESEEACLEFTNQYGLLYSAPVFLNEWLTDKSCMKRMVEMWETGKGKGRKEVIGQIEYGMNNPETLLFQIDSDTLNMHLIPTSLLVAMYLQLAMAMQGNKKFGHCAWCGTAFELTPSVARTNRRYCSNACKQADYRHRNKGK